MSDETKTGTDALKSVPHFIPAVRVQLPDGSTLIRPGKAIQRAQAHIVAKAFGLSTKTLLRLAEAGHIRSARVTPSTTFYYPGEIEDFIQKMEDNPDFWTPKRRREFGMRDTACRRATRKTEGGQ